MNERIRELAERATSIVEIKHEGYRGKGYTTQEEFFDREKFAELIVGECVMVLATELEGKVGSRIGDVTAKLLEEHFGWS